MLLERTLDDVVIEYGPGWLCVQVADSALARRRGVAAQLAKKTLSQFSGLGCRAGARGAEKLGDDFPADRLGGKRVRHAPKAGADV